MKAIHICLLSTLIFSACTPEPLISDPIPEPETTLEPDATLEPDTSSLPTADTWTPDTKGPWDGALYLSSSEDGLSFSGKELVLERAGVPNLLKLQSGDLVLTYQYFSDKDPDLFDVIAYALSTDNGTTWSSTETIDIDNLPEGLGENLHPMDPTLVQLEDGRLRLYFTYHAKGNKTAVLYSGTTPDSNIDSTFTVNKTPALTDNITNLLDPAVTFFDGLWHHYTWQMDSDENVHSTSKDGLSFTRQDDITLPMDFLGQVIPFENGLRFYGTGEGSVISAYSSDGFTWEIDEKNLAPGADPAVQKLNDGSYLMIFTSTNFN